MGGWGEGGGAWAEGRGGLGRGERGMGAYKIVTKCLKMSESVKKYQKNSNNVKKSKKI